MPSDDKWAQYEDKSSAASTASADKWEQYAQPASQAASPSFVPNARIRNLPNPAEGMTPGRALYEGAKTGLTVGSLPAAAASPVSTIRAGIGGAVGSGIASTTAKRMGAGELGQEVAGDIGGLAGGMGTEGLFQFGKAPLGKLLTTETGEPRLGLKMVTPKRAGTIAEYLRPDVKAAEAAAAEQADIQTARQQRAAAWAEMNKDFAKRQAAADTAAENARKDGMKPPPKRVVMPASDLGSSSSAQPGEGIPQGSPTPFQPIAQGGLTATAPPVGVSGITPPPKPTPAAAPTSAPTIASPDQPTSILSRGRTLVTPGLEPDLNNPVHVKMINDYQTMSGPALRQLASAGDRFAAFVLRHMPRP